MSGISDMLGEQESKVPKFQRLAKGKNSAERRKLEQSLLKPDKIPIYTGKKPSPQAKEPLLKSTVKFVFKKQEELALVKRTLPVSVHVEQSVSNHSLLILLLKEVDEGRITYNKKENTIHVENKKSKTGGSGRNKRTLQDWRMSQ